MKPQNSPTSPLQMPVGRGFKHPPAGFCDYEEYLDYLDDLRREWLANKPKTPKAKVWAEMYPELVLTFRKLIKQKREELGAVELELKIVREKETNNDISKMLKEVAEEKIYLPKIQRLKKEIRWLILGLEEENLSGFTEEQIQSARDVPVEDLIDEAPRNKMWHCPFHEERSPSFHIFKDNGWHCFGCQAHGKNAIDFIMRREKMDFVSAVKFLIGK